MSGRLPVDAAAITDALGAASLPDSGVDAAALAPIEPGRVDPVAHELVFSMLLWEASLDQARRGMDKLCETFVDCNEMRVCVPGEIASVLGPRHPRCTERAERLVATLRELSPHFPGLTLDAMRALDKREARKLLSSIESIPHFVAARVLLLALGAHAVPIDRKLARELHKAGFVDQAGDPDAVATALEREVRSADALWFYTKLEHWLDARGSGASKGRNAPGPDAVAERPGAGQTR